MRKALFALLIAFTATATSAFAQKDPAARKVLDAMANKYKAYKTMTVDFTLELNNQKARINRTQNGKAFLKGQKFRVEMGEQTIFSDGTNLYTYLKDANEMNISAFKPGDEMNPANMFTLYQKGYKYSMATDKSAAVAGQTVIDLVPEDASKPVFKVRLFIDKKTNALVSAKVFEKSGTQYTYTLRNLKPNAALEESLFMFDKKRYPGVTVSDLR